MRKLGVFVTVIMLSVFVFGSDFYVVKEGDTLSGIAENKGITVNELIEYNNLSDADFIVIGQELRLIPIYTQMEFNEQLVTAMVWYQTSGEFKALSYQAYNVAKMIFDKDIEEYPDETATRVVIVDIDETILNNTPWKADSIGANSGGYAAGFIEWAASLSAKPQPGALEFLNYVVETGGEVFYISNRPEAMKQITIDGLNKVGFPLADSDHVLLAATVDAVDKEPRRQLVDQNYKIVVLMGDNLNDFLSIFRNVSIDERNLLVDQMKEYWGTKFVVMPNPIYGDWEEAVNYWSLTLTPEEKDKLRKENLIKWNE